MKSYKTFSGKKLNWICECGNEPHGDGFFPCDEEGNEVEPTPEYWKLPLYLCGGCGHIYLVKTEKEEEITMLLGDIEIYMTDGTITDEGWNRIEKVMPIIAEEVLPVIELDESMVLSIFAGNTLEGDDSEELVHEAVNELLAWQFSFFGDSPAMKIILKQHKVSYETLQDLVLFHLIDKVMKVVEKAIGGRENDELKGILS